MATTNLETVQTRPAPPIVQKELSARLSSDAAVAIPNSEAFDSSDLRFTEYSRPTYVAAVRPACDQDVVATIKYAREKGIPFAARSGHHCVTTTMGRMQNGIVIDMRSIKHMHLNREKQEVTVGGGVITDDFARYLQGEGFEVTVGSCPTTGLIGVAFGAGLGRLQGKYGYLNDNMLSARLALADGSIVSASATQNPDLFWAIRGAGHNFGICLETTFRVHPQDNGGVHYTWDFEYGLERCEEVLEAVNRVHAAMPRELAIFVLWRRESPGGHKNLILVNLVFAGPESGAEPWVSVFEALQPVRSSGKVATTWDELPWETYGGQNKLLSKPEVWKLAPNKMMAAVSVKKFDIPTTKAFFESVKQMNERFAGKGWFGAMFECLPHHRTREFPDDATAFPWRNGADHFLMLTATPVSLEDREEFEAHLDKWKKAFVEVSGYGRLQQYVNYGNTTATVHDPVEALYGYEPWRLEKLRALKRQYDPDGVFSWYQPFM